MTEQQSFIVTARKWRPLRFADVVGQEHITTTLKNAIRSERIHHAYLFTGPRGVGKTTCARILARALNCPNAIDCEPCNSCAACTDVLEGRSVDVIEIDGASNNSVDDVRKLRENAKYSPMNGRYKMYIIDEVHMLSTAAFNALLKTLEEPPSHLIFVFATTEIHKVPATILSRCQRFDFRRMEIDTITAQLRHIAANEGYTIDDESLVAIAKKADGSMRDSQSIFDQVVAFCGKDIHYGEVSNALHLIDLDFFFSLSEAVRTHDVTSMFTLSRQVISRGYDLQECLVGLLEHFRNILTVLTTGSTSLIEASETFLKRYAEEATQFTRADVLRIMTMISQGEAVLRSNPPQPRIRFEFTLVQLAAMDSTVDLTTLLNNMGKGGPVPARTKASVAPASATPPAPAATIAPAAPAPTTKTIPLPTQSAVAPAPPTPQPSLQSIASRWGAFLDALPESLLFVRTAIDPAELLGVDITDTGITFRPRAEIIHNRLEDKLPQLRESLSTFYGTAVTVHLLPYQRQTATTAADTESGEAPANGAVSFDDSDELLPVEKAIMELFKARRAS